MAGDSDQQHLAKHLFPELDRADQIDDSDPKPVHGLTPPRLAVTCRSASARIIGRRLRGSAKRRRIEHDRIFAQWFARASVTLPVVIIMAAACWLVLNKMGVIGSACR